eukprot:CAMPEP_0115141922 /NCGR_PEP_ID=MMETSP0227-20121206/59847_1 /TAXON_ID=89957 /ORGANISM="Polarella glacialis, Strain CCMP 1383" /LENGTH=202 /DNA_ID=CAMNT_0002550419 /DNA_START=1 /DNA_END=605 /DNA_ORIENTATION=-
MEISSVLGQQVHVLDVGANIGACTIALAAAGHHVVAVEPHPKLFSQLNASVALNGFPSFRHGRHHGAVDVHRVALTSKEKAGRVLLWERPRNPAATFTMSLDAAAAASSVKDIPATYYTSESADAVTLDDTFFWQGRGPRSFDLVKIDVNGGELDVVEGAMRTFLRYPPKAFKFEFWPANIRKLDGDPLKLLSFFLENGYHL